MAKRQQKTAKKKTEPKKVEPKLRMLVVEARYYSHIADALLQGATAALNEADAEFDRIEVPGALEIPVAITIALEAARKKRAPYDGVVALGCVIQGETKHFDFICDAVANGVTQLNIKYGKPVIFGVLTPNNIQQAVDRAGGKHGNKGEEAAATAIKMLALRDSFAKK